LAYTGTVFNQGGVGHRERGREQERELGKSEGERERGRGTEGRKSSE
jgi:hypothetical protein